ncbi:MAG TPA: prepilin peptidase, partial [Frankiaceae bacterium]|nr:prepilin peptidase [Frankiaceae bacterium]
GMGYGDVKLAGLLGLTLGWLGWGAVLLGLVAGVGCGGLAALGVLALRRAQRRTRIPYGPFLLAGALAGALLHAGA